MRFECGVEKEGQIFCSLINENHESFSSLPRKTAQPPPVAATPRTCTSTTGLLILQVLSLAFPRLAQSVVGNPG
jgi:hypothetical protein